MKIVWDEPKRLANIDKHGLDFREVTLGFFEAAVIRPARLGRYKAIGILDDGTIAVIFATLGREALSIVSMRPASPQERKLLG